MANQQLVDFIKKSLSQNYSEADIKNILLKAGWQNNDIDAALAEATGAAPAPPAPPAQSATPYYVAEQTLSPTEKLPGFISLFKETFRIFFAHWKSLASITTIPFAFIFLTFGLFYWFSLRPEASYQLNMPNANTPFSISSALFFLPAIVIGYLTMLWSLLALVCTLKDREQGVGVLESYKKTKGKIFSFLLISILVILAIWGGFFLLIIPGYIFIVWFLFAAPYVLVYDELKGRKALIRSKQLIQGFWWAVVGRALLFSICISLLFLILVMPFAVLEALLKLPGTALNLIVIALEILTIPLTITFNALIYEGLKKIKQKQTLAEPTKSFKIILNIAIVLGLAAIAGAISAWVFLAPKMWNLVKISEQERLKTALENYYAAEGQKYPNGSLICILNLLNHKTN